MLCVKRQSGRMVRYKYLGDTDAAGRIHSCNKAMKLVDRKVCQVLMAMTDVIKITEI